MNEREAHAALAARTETQSRGLIVGDNAYRPAPERRNPFHDPIIFTLTVVCWLAGMTCVVTVAGYLALKLWSLF